MPIRRPTSRLTFLLSSVLAVLLVATACSKDPVSAPGRIVRLATAEAEFSVRGSVNQVFVTGAEKDVSLMLLDADHREVARGVTDALGSLIFREVEPGEEYRVQSTGTGAAVSEPFEVMSVRGSTPDQSFYDSQELPTDYGYITTRDGTTLSAAVYLPGPPEDGPYPTVVEYSGYSPSNPLGSLAEELAGKLGLEDPSEICGLVAIACRTPDQPGSIIAAAMGYAVVAVNVRGTGCSGGAYDFFEPLQILDGYDVIETVAAQPWVLNHKVGMVGLSYPGISQLFVAAARPPSLAAITPLSVYDDTARGVLAPGGIFNEGFALSWAENVLDNAKPYGQEWSQTVVEERDDDICADNQLLRLQNVDAVEKAKANPYYTDEVAGPLDPSRFVDRIDVPVFLAGAWQDEQTGGRFARLFDRFDNAPVVRFSGYNGAHADGFAPQILTEWKAFLDIYVAGDVTGVPETVRSFAGLLMNEIFGTSVEFPEDRWSTTAPFEEVKAAYEAEPPIRIIFESGAAQGAEPGAPVGRYEQRFSEWPIEGTRVDRWFLGDGGTLSPTSGDAGSARFAFERERGKRTTLPPDAGNDAFLALPEYVWEQDAPGTAAVFETPELDEDRVYIGTGSADLWIRSTTDDAHLQVTLSEIRPDGNEVYVSAGWLRASRRGLAADATELDPNPSGREEDSTPLVPGEWTQVRIEIFPFAHIVRAGSKLRISVHTPGGDRPRWAWILDEQEDADFEVAFDAEHASSVALPWVPQVSGYPRSLPICPGLRGQPCRPATPYQNTPGTPG